MKVRMTLTLDVDADEWAEEYGVDPAKVRDDIRTYIASSVVDLAAPINDVVLR